VGAAGRNAADAVYTDLRGGSLI